MSHREQSVVRDLIAGALVGAAATWVMDRVTTYLYDIEPSSVRAREDRARGNETAYAIAAAKAAQLLGRRLTPAARARYGTEIHWALGIGAGAAYALLRRRVPYVSIASGLAFGTAFWLVMDEALTAVLGLTPPPQAFPWQTHARGLAGHLVYGSVANTALALVAGRD